MQKTSTSAPFKVRELYKLWGRKLELDIITGKKGLKRIIGLNRVQKPGLRMIDPIIQLEDGKIQVFGRTEVNYFENLSPKKKRKVSDILSEKDIPCFIMSKGLKPPKLLKEAFEKKNVPLFITNLYTGRLIPSLNNILEERLAPFLSVHGVLIDIHRLGVLMLGKSGIGKSECALDLILRGSKLIADDVVEISQIGASNLIGSGPENIRHLMEIRGIGIINIKDLFGTTSVMDKREIDMVIELSQWDREEDYDRLGLYQKSYNIMDIELPYLVLPVSPGRNTATVVEVAVRNQLIKNSKVFSVEELHF
ncbi:HPr(Ser) kinase/phosphatase [Desulfobacterota bacterium AH_259_B03_O07]|nr:HPr(Ser) kinase/phosphatase [Desulfobacterota bacterium AH_259_B03_O07]